MKYYQVFDTEGKERGIVSGINMADACKKAREQVCTFPILVTLPHPLTIREVVEQKTNLEIMIASIIEENVVKFANKTGVPVEDLSVYLSEEDGAVSCTVNLHLNINAIK